MRTMKINMFEIIEKFKINLISEKKHLEPTEFFDRILSAGTLTYLLLLIKNSNIFLKKKLNAVLRYVLSRDTRVPQCNTFFIVAHMTS